MSFAVLAAILLPWLWLSSAAIAADFVLGPDGSDGNPGTKESPFATLEAARDACRKAGAGPHRIVVMPGDYYLTKEFELDARDNGLTIEAESPGKATLNGGRLVTGWRRDGEKFWCTDLPGVKEGAWDFRALVVGGRMAERARLPETGAFTHKTEWKGARYISGAWDPKPTMEQLTEFQYDVGDIPATFDSRNAEIRVYHMWDESLCGVASNIVDRRTLVLASPTRHPPGAFGVKKFAIYNTREGMTRPGQWYLDRTAGNVVYWPLPGEDMAKAMVVAPVIERVIRVAGVLRRSVENITLRGLGVQATTTPLGARGFGATGFGGAVDVEWSRGFTADRLDVCNAGGQGIVFRSRNEVCQILDSHVHHTGACAVEVVVTGEGSVVARNHIHHAGLSYPSSICFYATGSGLRLHRNEIHDGPYSGIVCNGRDHRIEENLVYRVMREMQDGAAIYGHLTKSLLRGNLVRDVVKMGEGFGAAAFYLDEQAQDCVVERNVSIGAERPIQNHIARDIVIRDNVFMADAGISLTFSRSARCTFEGNTVFAPGGITIVQPNAITLWTNNVVYQAAPAKGGAAGAFVVGDAMPEMARPERRSNPAVAVRCPRPPALDGEVGIDEWPGESLNLDRETSRWSASGVPVSAEVCCDDRCLYVAVIAGLYDIGKLRVGAAWGKDDGAEVSIAGRTPGGEPATYVIRGFAGGDVQSVTDAGAPADAAERLGKTFRFAAGKWNHGWRGEWAIPWEALGLNPKPGQEIPFNLAVFRAEDEVLRCWEGTLAENWRLDQAGTLLVK